MVNIPQTDKRPQVDVSNFALYAAFSIWRINPTMYEALMVHKSGIQGHYFLTKIDLHIFSREIDNLILLNHKLTRLDK